ncbi:MAG TPA: PEGA domain-containing protein [Vicinamibacterales bacterium]|nr:PEGA domain-containing protein [Vicinamibacterales bacterium]
MRADAAGDHLLNRRRFTQDEVSGPAGDPASRALFAWYAPGFSDRLGDRLNLFDNTEGPPLELLRLRAGFSRVADFEFSLRARVAELRDFDHPRFARVCRADRLPEPGGGLALVSVRTDGVRLSEILRLAGQRGARLGADLLLPLIADATEAVAELHGQGPHLVHGAINPGRLVVAPGGYLVVTEHVLGSALRGLPYDRDAFWRQLDVPLPIEPSIPIFDQRTDVLQLALVALALVLSRPLGTRDYPAPLPDLLEEAGHRVAGAGWDGRWPAFRAWLGRALLMDPGGFADAQQASRALAALVARPRTPRAGSAGWDQFVSECEAPPILTGDPRPVLPAPAEGSAPTVLPASPREKALSPSALDDWNHRGAGAEPGAARSPERLAPTGAPAAVPGAPDTAAPGARETAVPSPPSAGEHREWRPPRRPVATTGWRPRLVLALFAVLALIAAGQAIYIAFWFLPREGGPETGSVHVVSNPPDALVLVDGTAAGRTPVTLTLAAGSHSLELVAGTRRRALPVTLAAGAQLSHVVEMPPEVATTGQVRVTTQPEGLRVLVDGEARGSSPLLVADLEPGAHVITVEGRGRSARQTVEVVSGATAALFVPLGGGGAPAPGWLSVAGDVEFQVYENGELLGTSRSARIMLPAGRHEIDLVNEELGLRIEEEVQIPVGQTATVAIDLPRGRLDVNALPWAEVWLDGERIGETPLGGVPARVGRHVLTFKHPELGERELECVVALGRPTRVGVDLRK